MTNSSCFKATYLGDEVWFITDESHREDIPPDAIPYTLEEAQTLATKSEWTRRIAHEAKKAVGAKVTKPPLL